MLKEYNTFLIEPARNGCWSLEMSCWMNSYGERFPGFRRKLPVPVVEVQSESSYPGGAANVARNLRPFCKSVHISGLVGCDAAAGRLRNLLTAENIATEGLVEAAEIPTIVKTRIIARQQQVVRVDRERRLPTSNSAHDAVLGQLPGMLHECGRCDFRGLQ